MLVPFENDPAKMQLAAAARDLEACNEVTQRYGLSLSSQDAHALAVGRIEALEVTDRVELGGGVAKQLVLAFAGSPHVSQDTFIDTVLELQELFYEFKNESLEQIPDDDLIGKMRSLFDDVANGDLEYLAEALFDGLARRVREESLTADPDAANPDADNAIMNGYKLAARRYDVSKWVDEDFAPPWDGASWIDE